MRTTKPLHIRELRVISSIIYEKTGFRLKDYLIEQAFTRSSYSKRFGGGSNENFEYIGDTVIGYYVVKKLYDYYGAIHSDDENCYYTFRSHEKDFTVLKSVIVSNKSLAAVIDEWNVSQYLIVGQCDIDNEVDRQEKIKADLLESIIGAIAVQSKWNQDILEKAISRLLPIEEMFLKYENEKYRPLQFTVDNAVTTLKEMAEREECDFPQYDIAGPDFLGYTANGDPRWSCRISIRCWGITLMVSAHSKKDAKKYAAYLALCNRFELANEYGPSKRCIAWVFDGKKLFPNPPFDF
ncbi:MAG: hypothetical protein IJS90_07705 [Clostridia bacterium]|nr:hypothetical protein [Clostridia bacterium]